MARGFFVTGTDTGVGKTVAASAIVRALRAEGLDVGVFKPIETGVGDAGPLDALALRKAAEVDDALELICPIQFSLPAAPNVAAAHAATSVDLTRIRDAWRVLSARHEVVIVEGAGGLLVPISNDFDMADLAHELALPILLVARTALGTINHTLLSVHEIAARKLAFAGVVLSHATGLLSPADEANLSHLREVLGDRIVGEIPHLTPSQSVPANAIATKWLLEQIDE